MARKYTRKPTREEAKAKAKELKKKGNRVIMDKEATP